MNLLPFLTSLLVPETSILTIIFILLGLSCGSFVSMVSYRLPLGLSLTYPNSTCPACHHQLSWKELIPVWSWLINLGKCAYCKQNISIRYPLIECSLALIFVFIKINYGIGLDSLLLCFTMLLIVTLIVTDLEHYIIPNSILLLLFPIAVIFKYTQHLNLSIVLLSGLTYFAIGFSLRWFFQVVRKKEALGFGDVKFLFIIGMFLNLDNLPLFMFISGILGIILGSVWQFIGYGKVFPFGPALAVSLIICLFFPSVNSFYLSWIGNLAQTVN